MRRLTKVEINNLSTGDVRHIKLVRLHDPKSKLIFEGNARVFVKKHPKTGAACVVTSMDHLWAEAGANDITEDGYILVEDYQMEIFAPETTVVTLAMPPEAAARLLELWTTKKLDLGPDLPLLEVKLVENQGD